MIETVANGSHKRFDVPPKRWWDHLGVMAQNVRLVSVTPQMAEELLKRNIDNRPLSGRSLKIYARIIEMGLWKANGETIIFDKSGRLINGQHRLHAIVQAGKTVMCYMVFDVDQDAFDTIDQGAKRVISQTLALNGVTNAKTVSAAISLLWNLKKNSTSWNQSPTIPEARQWFDDNPAIEESASICRPLDRELGFASAFTAMHFLATSIDKTLADGIIRQLVSGANLEEGDPVLVLRRALIKFKNQRDKPRGAVVLAMAIKMWNAIRADRRPKLFIWRDSEPFPELI